MSEQDFVREQITKIYDRTVVELGGQAFIADIKTAMHDEVYDLIASSPRDIEAEVKQNTDVHVGSVRDSRANNLKKVWEYVAEARSNLGDGEYLDHLIDQAYRTGDQRGVDKVLRNWTDADIAQSQIDRYQQAAQVTKAADEFASAAGAVRDFMHASNAATINDLFPA